MTETRPRATPAPTGVPAPAVTGTGSAAADAAAIPAAKPAAPAPALPKEIGGPKGPEPTRYGDWEKNGRCSDF